MLHAQFKNSEFLALVEEDNIPYICGLEREKDIYFSIKISIYKNVKGKKSSLLSRYFNMWDTPVSKDAIINFISNILKDVTFRERYRISELLWCGTIDYDFSSFDKSSIVFSDNYEKMKKSNIKTLKPIAINTVMPNNLSLKLDLISLFVSDADINYIQNTFNYRPAIVYALKLLVEGCELEKSIKETSLKFNLNRIYK